MRGRNHAHVGANRTSAAHAIEFPLLQNAQKCHLHLRGQFADFVQKDRSTFSKFKAPQPPLQRSRERSLVMPEQFRGDQIPWNRCAINRDKRPCRSRRT